MNNCVRLSGISILVLLQACSSVPEIQNNKEETQLSSTENAIPQTFIMRGTLVAGADSRTFTPCESNEQFWLEASPEILQAISRVQRDSYDPMYAEFVGHLVPTLPGMPGGEFDAKFVASSVNFISTENPNRCHIKPTSTKASGNEPSWIAMVNNDALTFKRMGFEDQVIPLKNKQLSGIKRTYFAENTTLTLDKTFCRDTMSDSLFGWSAQLDLGSETKSGCAQLSGQDVTAKWSGVYSANSTKSGNFSVTLTLSHDHTASTIYSYGDGSLDTTEKGFWQQVNDQQIQVIMTRHQGLKLISNRLFTLQDNQLVTTEEKVNGTLYPIADGGLILYPTN